MTDPITCTSDALDEARAALMLIAAWGVHDLTVDLAVIHKKCPICIARNVMARIDVAEMAEII